MYFGKFYSKAVLPIGAISWRAFFYYVRAFIDSSVGGFSGVIMSPEMLENKSGKSDENMSKSCLKIYGK